LLIRLLVCALMGAARLAELAYSRRNIGAAGETVEGVWTRRTYPLIMLLHTLVIGGTAFLGGNRPRMPWLVLLLVAQPLRVWTIATLRERWNARAAVPRSMEVATNGPYAFVRHPNYLVVAVELATLPLAFGLSRLALFASASNGVLLAGRIREEEEALFRLPGYREHFQDRKRFLPFVF
jgi:methyltransferase